MNKYINIGSKDKTLEYLKIMKENEYVPFDLKITNAHIMELNGLIGRRIFKKDSLYINSFTLWEIMQDVGVGQKHNHHGLTEEDVYLALSSLKDPRYFYISKMSRYAVITTELSHFNLPLMIIIDTKATANGTLKSTVNKIVTIYPKDNVDNLVKNLDEKCLLYVKK